MNQVYVVYYDEIYPGYGERGAEQRRIDSVYADLEQAQDRVQTLRKLAHITYADCESYEVIE